MQLYKTILGNVRENDIGITLPHEHICCYSEHLYSMAGSKYLDKVKLIADSVNYLRQIKDRYSLNTFIDCTPINIGRDIDLLKNISEKAEINIICSTGFYHTEEPLLYNIACQQLTEFIIFDALKVNAGVIKCAVEDENISDYCKKVLIASAKAHLELNLPIIMHTNARNRNGTAALDILMSEGVLPQAITVSHLSDTEDIEYIKTFAAQGCYVGIDRLYGSGSEEYIRKKLSTISALLDGGYEDKILLSHDASFFNGFEMNPEINTTPRLNYCFDHILPNMTEEQRKAITVKNPIKMLGCK